MPDDQLHLREFFQRALLDNVPFMVWLKDTQSRFIEGNRGLADAAGVETVEELYGKSDRDFFSQDIADAYIADDQEVMHSRQKKSVEEPGERPDGRYWLETWKAPLLDEDGTVLGTVGFARDITERKVAEERLRQLEAESACWESDQRYREVFENVSDSLFMLEVAADVSCRYLEVNPAFEKFAGVSRSQLVGTRVGEHLPEKSAHKLREPLLRCITTRAVVSHELELELPEGNHIFHFALFPELDDSGRVHRIVGIARDITLQVEAESLLIRHRNQLQDLVAEQTGDLLQAKQAAERANHAKSMFLANMTHELRTPLHGILAFAQLGLDRLDTLSAEQLKKYFSSIHDSGSRLLLLVNDLLDLSKLEAGKTSMHLENTCLAGLVRDIADEMEPLLQNRDMLLELQPPACDTTLLLDRAGMGQVLRNLFSNAIKFSPHGSTITVCIKPAVISAGRRANDRNERPGVCLTVADEGVGIPKNELEQIFDEFVQSSKTHSGAGGTGLGLAICRRIVSAHHGRIFASNRAERGAEFSVLLPRTLESAPDN